MKLRFERNRAGLEEDYRYKGKGKMRFPVFKALVLAVILAVVRGAGAGGETTAEVREIAGRYQAATGWDVSVSLRAKVELQVVSDKRGTWKRVYEMTYRRDSERVEWFGESRFFSGESAKRAEHFVRVMNGEYYVDANDEIRSFDFQGVMKREYKEIQRDFLKNSLDGGFLDGRINNIGEELKIADKLLAGDSVRLAGKGAVNGEETLILEAATRYGTITAWVAPEKGYNAVRYSICKKDEDLVEGDRITEQEAKEYTIIVDVLEFQKIDDFYVPVSGNYKRSFAYPEGGRETVTYHAERKDIVLKPDFKALGAFSLRVPEGTILFDLDHSGREVQVRGETLVPYAEEKTTGQPLYDPQADAEAAIQASLVRAKKEHKHVILLYGFNACGWCHKLHGCLHKNENLQKILDANYVLVLVDVSTKRDFPKRYGAKPKGYPFLTVLDAEGVVMVHQDPSEWVRNRAHDVDQAAAFLTKWKPVLK